MRAQRAKQGAARASARARKSNSGRTRRRSVKRASEPYDPSVSAASITPSAYLMPSTDVPVTMGLLRGGGGYARVGGTQAGTRFFSETARTPRKAPDNSSLTS